MPKINPFYLGVNDKTLKVQDFSLTDVSKPEILPYTPTESEYTAKSVAGRRTLIGSGTNIGGLNDIIYDILDKEEVYITSIVLDVTDTGATGGTNYGAVQITNLSDVLKFTLARVQCKAGDSKTITLTFSMPIKVVFGEKVRVVSNVGAISSFATVFGWVEVKN